MPRRPSSGNIGDGFGWRHRHPITGVRTFHYGEDIGWGNGAGTKLVAPMAGRVSYNPYAGGFGRLVEITAGSTRARLAHTYGLWPGVKAGDWVDEGQLVAVMGDTGAAAGVHVHWEVLVNGVQIDPAGWLASTAGGGGTPVVVPPTPEPPTEEEEEEMTPRQIHAKIGEQIHRALIVPGTGYFVKWTESENRYANALAKNMDTGDSTEVTASLFGVFQREAAALRPRDALSIELAEVS